MTSIDSNTYALSGYAWSENVGWLQFNPAGPYPSTPNHAAQYNKTTHVFSGWARFLANGGGWDGWVKLGNDDGSGTYGVTLNVCDLQGYAAGSDVVGWIKFSGTAQDGSTYKVTSTICTNQPPTANSLSAQQPDYCNAGPNATRFTWSFSDPGDTQSAYQVQIATDQQFNSIVHDSQKVLNSGNAYSPPSGLDFGSTYYWRLMVWDSEDVSSVGWIYPPGPPTSRPGTSFTTPTHAYPHVVFSYVPTKPAAGEAVVFTDQSTCYNASGPVDCVSWDWAFTSGAPASGSGQNPPPVTFPQVNKSPGYPVTLQVKDPDNNVCPSTRYIKIYLPLPDWKEITPGQ